MQSCSLWAFPSRVLLGFLLLEAVQVLVQVQDGWVVHHLLVQDYSHFLQLVHLFLI
jgi:hypothetical protein